MISNYDYGKITKIVARQNELRIAIDEIVADIEGKAI
jgi:hypothetical protein